MCIRRKVTSLNVAKDSVLVRRGYGVGGLVSLPFNCYRFTVTDGRGGSICPMITAGCIGFAERCFSSVGRPIGVVGLGKSMRLTTAVSVTSTVVSVIRSNGALRSGNLDRRIQLSSVGTHLVSGGRTCFSGCSRVRAVVGRLGIAGGMRGWGIRKDVRGGGCGQLFRSTNYRKGRPSNSKGEQHYTIQVHGAFQ